MKIRKSVFETNSSSSHSISISAGDSDALMDTIKIPESGVLELGSGEYGWEWEKYNDAATKADYCAIYCRGSTERRLMLTEVLKKQTGAQVIFTDDKHDDGGERGYVGYIDHESAGAAHDAFNSPESLRNFIFNKSSWLFLGNDNSEAPNGFYDAPDTSYPYGLVFEGFPNETWKFEEKPEVADVVEAIKSKFGMGQNVLSADRKYFFEPMIYPHLAFEFKMNYKDPSGNFGVNFHRAHGDYDGNLRGWVNMVKEDRMGKEIETVGINFSVQEL